MNFWLLLIVVVALGVLLCFLLAIANHSGERFMDEYKEMNNIPARTKLTPLDFVDYIIKKYININLEIVHIKTIAGDAYSKRKLYLSSDTIARPSLASFTIIAHELGHALQDKEGKKIKRLNFLRKLGKTLGTFLSPCLIAGFILLCFEMIIIGIILISFSVLIFLLALIIKIATISIEKDASEKAIVFLKDILDEEDVERCKKLLIDARLTYWGDFLRVILFWTGASKKTQLFN